jgi:hypothetical protein
VNEADDGMEEMSAIFKQTASKLTPSDLSETALRKAIAPAFAAFAHDHGIPVPRESDSPGNYTFLKLPDGGWRLVWTDDVGQEGYWSKDDVIPPHSP